MAKKTSTTVPLNSTLLYLQDFLDSVGGLSSGETLFYKKTYGEPKSRQLTSSQWETLTGLKKKF